RMFEKMYARIIERAVMSPFPKRQIAMWGLGVAKRWSERRNLGKPVGPWLGLQHRIADALVYKKLRQAVGGNIRCFISGGAPLAPEIAHVFTGAGLPMFQGYGLTETSPSISCNTEKHNRIGSVGRVLDGVSVKIAPDGEILAKGDTITRGYYNSPEKNAEVFTPDGWFQTGDVGYLDQDGFLFITDRKKELIKTSGGKYIAPQQIESLIMSSRFVSQVVVIGDKRRFASALIHPNVELLRNYAEIKGIKYSTVVQLIHDPKVVDLIQRQVNKYTSELARYEQIKKIAMLDSELSVDTGELTPTLKPKRRFIEDKYKSLIEALYEEPEPVGV
ncbi:MAG: AMP-dependent synthetase/ligase, partial [Blastocatellia bacterium]